MAWSLPRRSASASTEPALTRPQIGQGDRGVPARSDGGLELALGPEQDGLGVTPSAQFDEQRRLHAVAVVRQEEREDRRRSRSSRRWWSKSVHVPARSKSAVW